MPKQQRLKNNTRMACWAFAAALAAMPASAHDFWLQPTPFWTAPNSSVPMLMLVGHGAVRQRSTIRLDRLNLFRSVGPRGGTDHKTSLTLGRKSTDAALSFAESGTYVVYFSTTNAPSELPAQKFNDYAAAEGLTLVTRHRAVQDKTRTSGRELYSRRGKALLQVGQPGTTGQSQVTAPVGLSLEIVPLINPYHPGAATSLPVQVLFQGRPLAGALVKLNNLNPGGQTAELHRTDANGRANFQLKRSGKWQLNVVWSQPLTNTRAADFLTTFSSLSFGFNP